MQGVSPGVKTSIERECKISGCSVTFPDNKMDLTTGPRDWENPNVFSRNKCRSHVPLRAHPSPESALVYFIKDPKAADNANLLNLNSSGWNFHLYDRPEDVPRTFSNPDFDDGQWGKVSSSPCFFLGRIGAFQDNRKTLMLCHSRTRYMHCYSVHQQTSARPPSSWLRCLTQRQGVGVNSPAISGFR